MLTHEDPVSGHRRMAGKLVRLNLPVTGIAMATGSSTPLIMPSRGCGHSKSLPPSKEREIHSIACGQPSKRIECSQLSLLKKSSGISKEQAIKIGEGRHPPEQERVKNRCFFPDTLRLDVTHRREVDFGDTEVVCTWLCGTKAANTSRSLFVNHKLGHFLEEGPVFPDVQHFLTFP